jgi:hypothetical protein
MDFKSLLKYLDTNTLIDVAHDIKGRLWHMVAPDIKPSETVLALKKYLIDVRVEIERREEVDSVSGSALDAAEDWEESRREQQSAHIPLSE